MSSVVGLLFLCGGVVAFVACILFIAARNRLGRAPTHTVAGFERSRMALHKIHLEQVTVRDTTRARARAMHPAGRRKRARRTA